MNNRTQKGPQESIDWAEFSKGRLNGERPSASPKFINDEKEPTAVNASPAKAPTTTRHAKSK